MMAREYEAYELPKEIADNSSDKKASFYSLFSFRKKSRTVEAAMKQEAR